jgi:iron complex outermembrane recepter protein
LVGSWKMEEQWYLDMGIRKPLWGKRAFLNIAVSDIFKTRTWKGISDYGGIKIRWFGYNDTRMLRFNLAYNLGNQQVKASRSRTTALDEEKNRAIANE